MFESVVVVPIYIYTCILFPWHSLRFYISRCSALALVINCFSTFFFFFSIPRGSVVPAEGIIFRYFILERYFPFRREVCYYSHLREIRPVKSSDPFDVRNIYPELDISKDRRFEETFIGYSPSSISTLTVIRSRVSVVSKVKLPADVYRCKDSI